MARTFRKSAAEAAQSFASDMLESDGNADTTPACSQAYDSEPDPSYEEVHDPADYDAYLERQERLYGCDYPTANDNLSANGNTAKQENGHRLYPATYAGESDATTRNHFTIGIDTSREYVPPDDLVEGLITRVSRNGIVGGSGAGKSFVIAELAACVVNNMPFAGRDILRPGGFGYFSYESSGTIEPRWRGLELKYPGLLSDRCGKPMVPYFPVARPLSLSDGSGWRAMEETLKRMQDVSLDVFDVPLVAVAVDTVHASQMVAKENDSDEWKRPLDKMLQISEDFKFAFIVAHHSGKSSDGADGKSGEGNLWRGSGAAVAALDNIIAIKADKREGKVARRYMYLEKSKDGETGYIADIATKVHTIGLKRNGKPATTLTLEFQRKNEDDMRREKGEARAKAKAENWKPTAPAKKLMQAIRIVAQNEGRAVKLSTGEWSYTASQNEVEAEFKKSAGGNPGRDLRSAVLALTNHAGMEIDKHSVTYELKRKEPIPLGAFA